MSVATAAVATSQDLVRFLLARVDDDDTELKRLARQHARAHVADELDGIRAVSRLQAESAAKRRVIGALQQLLVLRDQPFEKAIRDQAAQMLRILAMPYDGHAAYRSEWRPSGSR
jgi:anti-sigma factor ChrR (cupin superfamily)